MSLSVLSEESFKKYLQPIKTPFYDKHGDEMSMWMFYKENETFFQYK